MNIVIAASEIFPFCKTGGLADAVSAMAQIFARAKDNKVAVFVPRYRNIGAGAFSLKAVPGSFRIPMGDRIETVTLSTVNWGGVKAYFVESPRYYDRDELYRTRTGDFADNDERFIFFSRAVLEAVKFINFKPDVIHCHDWQTGLIPAYLKTLYQIDAYFASTASVLTIHNIAYQGFFPKESVFKAGFSWREFTPDKLEYYGGANFLKSGVVYADQLTTVSPTYAREVKSDYFFGRGLEGLLNVRADALTGILNGIDTEVWDPEMDSYIPYGYEASSYAKGKALAKQELQKTCGLAQLPSVPLVGVVSRLEHNKGTDMVLNAAQQLSGKAQFCVLGVGEPHLQEAFQTLAESMPTRVAYCDKFNEALAHNIYAGADLFLMPSRTEPCGLSQMIAMRYGTVPVVTRTGGLADTVTGYDQQDKATGFVAPNANFDGVMAAMHSALAVYQDKKRFSRMIQNGMRGDYSWDKPAKMYIDVFRKAMGAAR